MEQRLNIFIAYAPSDEEMKNEMEKHLNNFRKNRKIRFWSNTNITVANNWDAVAKNKLKQADIILILISQDFLNAESMWKDEVNLLIERHSYGTALVIPIILSPFTYQTTPILNFQFLPKDGRPVTTFTDREIIYAEIFNDIEQLITAFNKKQKWLRLIEEETTKHTGKLDLSKCELTSIPKEIQKMEWLTELNLSGNQIIAIQGLDTLTALKRLDLSSNQTTTIQGLDALTALNRLNLSGNQITTIQGLDKLTALTELYLHSNQITTIQGLDQLTALNWLSLDSNQITTIQGLEVFPISIEKLHLFDNPI